MYEFNSIVAQTPIAHIAYNNNSNMTGFYVNGAVTVVQMLERSLFNSKLRIQR